MGNPRAARSALQKLFVYGSLKRGEPKHCWMKNESNGYAKYICDATTTVKLPLVIATRYNIPFLLKKPGVGNYVAGQIYDVDERMLSRLDDVEGANFLKREVQDMNMGLQEGVLPCFVYLLRDYPEYLETLPFLSEYKNSPRHPYQVERDQKTLASQDLLYNLFIKRAEVQ